MFIISDDKLPFGQIFFRLEHIDTFCFVRDTVIRDECNTETDPCEINEQIVAGELDLRHEVQLMLLKEPVKEFVRGTVFIQHQDRIFEKLAEGKLFPLQLAVSITCDKDIPESFYADDARSIPKIIIRIIYDDEIHKTVF